MELILIYVYTKGIICIYNIDINAIYIDIIIYNRYDICILCIRYRNIYKVYKVYIYREREKYIYIYIYIYI